jgi:hypothetical protein
MIFHDHLPPVQAPDHIFPESYGIGVTQAVNLPPASATPAVTLLPVLLRTVTNNDSNIRLRVS